MPVIGSEETTLSAIFKEVGCPATETANGISMLVRKSLEIETREISLSYAVIGQTEQITCENLLAGIVRLLDSNFM